MDEVGILRAFYKGVFGGTEGLVCLAYRAPKGRAMREEFFRWPFESEAIINSTLEMRKTHNVYYCPQLFTTKKRTKDSVLSCPSLWADLDTCHPDLLLVSPTITIESSPQRFQALWSLETDMVPSEAEELCKRIAYRHAEDGADRSGWDLTQLLRPPCTINYKYDSQPSVGAQYHRSRYRSEDFDLYPVVPGTELLSLPFPDELPAESGLDIIQEFRRIISPIVMQLYSVEPGHRKWSDALWQLEMLCLDAGMSREQVFVVARDSACNKYKREGRDEILLWKEVCRAFAKHQENMNVIIPTDEIVTGLLTDRERATAQGRETFVERYISWASGVGDAATQYHQAGAFITLSSLLSGFIRLPTSYGTVLPNLWFMILADTTLTRKTTAMDLAVDLVELVDPDALMATDGSIEGLLTAMSLRPNRPSIFLRDEFTGLIDGMNRKDYMAGTAELLTKLYDGKTQKRILRKEIIEVREPILITFAGGIKAKLQSLLTFEHVSSGFMPRFVFLTAESDMSRFRPLGPPTERDIGNRQALVNELEDMIAHYNVEIEIPKGTRGLTEKVPYRWMAEMTPAAWTRFAQLETDLMTAGLASEHSEVMTPTYARLAGSILKAAVLIAAAERRATGALVVEDADLIQAIYYGEGWRGYAHEVINGIGRSGQEAEFDKLLRAIRKHPEGIPRSRLMQGYHLTAKQADVIFSTLEERGQITSTRLGGTKVYHAINARTVL